MISYVKGILAEILSDSVVIETGGVGINIRMPQSAKDELPGKGAEAKIYTYMYVREDMINLFGFLTRDDLDIFKLLINVSGIGPKGALSILSTMSPDELRLAILTGDTAKISKSPGIGKKTAERAALELKDKVSTPVMSDLSGADINDLPGIKVSSEAVEALIALGIPEKKAESAVTAAGGIDDMPVEQLIKEALKHV